MYSISNNSLNTIMWHNFNKYLFLPIIAQICGNRLPPIFEVTLEEKLAYEL